MKTEGKKVSKLDSGIISNTVRLKNEKEIYAMIKESIDEGNISDEGLLRFYIATYKLNKVNELIKEDKQLKEIIDNLALEFNKSTIDGKKISHGVTYTKKEFENPITDIKQEIDKLFKDLDNLSEVQKALPEGTNISVNLDTIELADNLIELGHKLKDMHGSVVDLDAPIKYQTHGIKLANIKF
jgi:hypothetical protein